MQIDVNPRTFGTFDYIVLQTGNDLMLTKQEKIKQLCNYDGLVCNE